MSRTSRCPNCGCTVFLPGRAAGMKVTCRSCGQVNRVIADAAGEQALVAADADAPSVHPSLRRNTLGRRRVRRATWALLLIAGLGFASTYALSFTRGGQPDGDPLGAWIRDVELAINYGLVAIMVGFFIWARLGTYRVQIPIFVIVLALLLLGIASQVVSILAAPELLSRSGATEIGRCLLLTVFALIILGGLLGALRDRRDRAAVSSTEADDR